MKTLQHALEGLLDSDFDIHDEDVNFLEEFLRKWKYGNRTKMVAPFNEFCDILKYAGTEIKRASINDVKKAIKSGNGFICVANDEMNKRTNWFLRWPKSPTTYYIFDTKNQVADWSGRFTGSCKWIENECSGLSGEKQVAPQYLPGKCRFFELPKVQYEKFIKVFN